MNQYFVHYLEDGIAKTAKNFKSRKDAEEFKKEKDSSPNQSIPAVVTWKEIVPNNFGPYSDTRTYKDAFVYGNIVRVNEYSSKDNLHEYREKLAIVNGSFATLCGLIPTNNDKNFHEYNLLFLDGGYLSWVNQSELEFFSVGDPILVNMWYKKYNNINADDSISLVEFIKNIEREK